MGIFIFRDTQVKAQQNINLDSAKDILLKSGQSQQKADGKNSNAGLSVGVGVSVGAQTGVYAMVKQVMVKVVTI